MAESDTEVLRTQLEPKLIKKTSDTLGIGLGTNWRIIEGPYPNPSSPSCMQIQSRNGTDWKTVSAFSADGSLVGPNAARVGLPNMPLTVGASTTQPVHFSNNVWCVGETNVVGPWPHSTSLAISNHGGMLLCMWYITGSIAVAGLGTVTLTIDGTPYDSAVQYLPTGMHVPIVGFFTVAQGAISAGSHTVQFAWNGTSDGNDRLCYIFLEFPLV